MLFVFGFHHSRSLVDTIPSGEKLQEEEEGLPSFVVEHRASIDLLAKKGRSQPFGEENEK